MQLIGLSAKPTLGGLRKRLGFLIAASVLAAAGCGGGGKGGTPAPPPAGGGSYGAILPSVSQVENAPKPLIFGAGANPSTVDLSTDPAMPPVGNQFNQGSCVAWAVGYGLCTFEVNKASNTNASSLDSQASASDVYALTIASMVRAGRSASCGGGTDPAFALDALNRVGSLSMAASPYSDAGCVDAAGGTFMIRGWHTIEPGDVETIKTMLNQGHPVAIAMAVPGDFRDFLVAADRTQVYQARGQLTGSGHAMLIVGFDDGRQAWRVMNSWGTDRGDHGFFWMSYDAFSRVGRAAYVADGGGQNHNPPAPGGTISFTSVAALQYLDYTHYVAYLVMPYTLSEPVYVTQWRLRYEENGATTPWQTVNQWTYSSYVWWGLQNQSYPAGRYSVEFLGLNRAGATVDVVGTAQLTLSTNAVHASSQTIQPLLSTTTRKSGSFPQADLTPGLPMLMNGHMVKLQ